MPSTRPVHLSAFDFIYQIILYESYEDFHYAAMSVFLLLSLRTSYSLQYFVPKHFQSVFIL
jgi:hypothetical protein